ncbi:hypothetical protein [Chitinophaga sp.]|uniref:hypothetical protein n=1 Tax=Chitinophaga sp. TaxID=1869181 RepID=UPI0031E07931
MNGAHFHLIVNHLPIIIPLVAILVLIIGFIAQSEVVKRTAYGIFFIGAITTALAMATGEGAEKEVEKIDTNAKVYIERHEDAADTFAIVNYALGICALIGIWGSFRKVRFLPVISIGIIVLAIIALFFAKQAGTTGGEIRHTEIRSSNDYK